MKKNFISKKNDQQITYNKNQIVARTQLYSEKIPKR